jgi:hypothetical protein
MGGICSTRGRHEKRVQNLGRKTYGEDNSEDLGVYRKWKGVDWMHLAQYREQWWAVVNTVMNSRVPLKTGNLLTSWVTASFSRRTLLRVIS